MHVRKKADRHCAVIRHGVRIQHRPSRVHRATKIGHFRIDVLLLQSRVVARKVPRSHPIDPRHFREIEELRVPGWMRHPERPDARPPLAHRLTWIGRLREPAHSAESARSLHSDDHRIHSSPPNPDLRATCIRHRRKHQRVRERRDQTDRQGVVTHRYSSGTDTPCNTSTTDSSRRTSGYTRGVAAAEEEGAEEAEADAIFGQRDLGGRWRATALTSPLVITRQQAGLYLYARTTRSCRPTHIHARTPSASLCRRHTGDTGHSLRIRQSRAHERKLHGTRQLLHGHRLQRHQCQPLPLFRRKLSGIQQQSLGLI
jgi:hypothetical protein